MRLFRYKRSLPVSYERQGYIYFASRLYEDMPGAGPADHRRAVPALRRRILPGAA